MTKTFLLYGVAGWLAYWGLLTMLTLQPVRVWEAVSTLLLLPVAAYILHWRERRRAGQEAWEIEEEEIDVWDEQ